MSELYSIENAKKFDWSSVSGNLTPERVLHLENYLIGNKILDAGCGGGAYVEFLAQKGLEATGVDKYEEFLQLARENQKLGTYLQGDITNLPFPDKTFDCTFCFDVLEHVDDKVAIQELVRVTTKRLIFTVPQKDELMHKYGLLLYPYQDPTHLRYYTENSIKELVSKISFNNLHVFPEGIIPMYALFKEVIEEEKFNPQKFVLRPSYKLKTFNPLLNKIINKLTDLLIRKVIDAEKLDKAIIDYLATSDCYKHVNLGLAVVVDIESVL